MNVPGLSQTGVNLFDVMVTKPHYQPPLTPPPEEEDRSSSRSGNTAAGVNLDDGVQHVSSSTFESISAPVKGEEDAVFYRTLQQIQKVCIVFISN